MKFVEKTAKTIDEAVAIAVTELGVAREQVEVEVLEQPKKGILGFFGSDAKVRVTVKEVAPQEIIPEREAELPEVPVAPPAPCEVSGKVKVVASAESATATAVETLKLGVSEESALKGEAKGRRVRKQFRGDRKREGEKLAPAPSEDMAIAEKVAKEFLQQLFTLMHMEVVIEKFSSKGEGTIAFCLRGRGMGVLIGKHGQTLDDIQYLVNLVANKQTAQRVRINVDIEDYKLKRKETLIRLARRIASQVKRSGEKVELEPMNPYERKIIHMALQNERGVTTYSEGEEPKRRAIIAPK